MKFNEGSYKNATFASSVRFSLMVMKITLGPSQILQQVAQVVDMQREDLKDIQSLMDTMLQTMRANHGIGLAAPQVGLSKRIFVMDLQDDNSPLYAINPCIDSVSESKRDFDEGCLSFPQQYVIVTRPKTIEVSFLDYEGKTVKKKLSGLAATCFQHEHDHLNGVTILDYLHTSVPAN